jgi:hypothetical protein
MPIMQTANGPVMVDDNTPPDVLARIRAANGGPPKARAAAPVKAAPMSADDREIQTRVNAQRKQNQSGIFGETGAGVARKVFQGFTFNNLDEISGGLHALTALPHGWDAMKHEYRIARDTERNLDTHQSGTTGIGGTIGEIAGALANPIAEGANVLRVGGKFVPILARAATKVDKAPAVVKAILAGGNQGALNAVGSANDSSDLANKAMQGYMVGGATGGIFGGLATGARRGVQILRDRGADAAERIAYGKVGDMLSKAKVSPAAAERELAVTNARGGDGMVQDLTPGLRAQAGNLSRRPDVPASNDLIERGEQRLRARNDRFDAELQRRVGNADADAHIAGINAARKGAGKVDYEQALDGKFHWSNELQDFVDKADPEIHAAFRDGAKLASLHDQDIGKLGMQIGADGKPILAATPSMRVFDYTKRAMDARIAGAYKAGNEPLAAGLSNQLGKLKQLIMDANPDYAPALAKQRDFFQRAEATQLGLNVISRLKSEPKKVLKELQALDPSKHADARQGIADALLNLRTQKADPAAFIYDVTKSPEQRAVLEFAFGGAKNYKGFTRWLGRELRSTKADVLTAPGRQSETSRLEMAGNSFGGNLGQIAENAGRGFAYGGGAGASAAVLRTFHDLKNGMSPHALDAMAKALMSDGQQLPGKVAQAAKFAAGRKARNARWATRIAKGAQQPYTDFAGD